MRITHQVTDVEGPVAAVSSMNDGGMTAVFSPQGARVSDDTPLKPVGCTELKRENRMFWMDMPRADAGNVQRMMALRREQHVEQVEQIAGNPVIGEKRQEASSSADSFGQDWRRQHSYTLCKNDTRDTQLRHCLRIPHFPHTTLNDMVRLLLTWRLALEDRGCYSAGHAPSSSTLRLLQKRNT